MKRPVKIVAWVVGVLVLLLVVATVGIKLYLTKDRIMALVVPPLEEQLHRKVTLADAGAGLTGIHLDGLDVRSEGAAEPLVAAQTIQIRWNLMALLTGTVQVDEVRLVEPRIHVARLADGTLSIADLMAAREGGAGEGEAAKPVEPGGGKPPVALVVGLFSLQNGRVAFEDRTVSPARTYALEEIESRITEFSLDKPVRYELSAKLPLAEAGRFSVAGTLNPATQDVVAKLTVTDFEMASLNPVLEGGTQFASGVLGVDLDLQVTGGQKADVKGTVGIRTLELSAGGQTGQETDLAVELEAGADLAAGTATVPRLDLEAAGQKVHVEATAKGLNQRPRVEFQVTSPELQADAFTALLPPAGEGAPTAASSEPAPAGKPSPLPLDAYGDVKVGKLLAGGLEISDFASHIELEKGVLKIDPAGATVYGGTLGAALRSELERTGPPFQAKVELGGTELGAFAAGLSPKLKDTMTGTLNLGLDASGRGGDLQALRSKVLAEAKDGKILNHPMVMNFAQMFKVKELETLNFYSMKADLETVEGVGKLNSFILNGPNLQATGTGTVGLVSQQLDMRLAVALPKNIAAKIVPNAQTLEAVTDKEGWTRLPMHLKGSLSDPSYGLDAEGLAKAATKALGGKAEKLLQEKVLKEVPVGEEQKGAIQKGIKSLFGQ